MSEVDLRPKAQRVRTALERVVDKKIAEAVPRYGARVLAIPIVVGVPGVPLTTGTWVLYTLDVNRDVKVIAWSVGAHPAGSVTIDILSAPKGSLASAVSICGSTIPFVSGAAENSDQDPTGWVLDENDVTLPDGRWIVGVVTAVDGTVEVASVTLRALVQEVQKP